MIPSSPKKQRISADCTFPPSPIGPLTPQGGLVELCPSVTSQKSLLSKLRKLTCEYNGGGGGGGDTLDISNALLWSEILVSLSNDPQDILLHANNLFKAKKFYLAIEKCSSLSLTTSSTGPSLKALCLLAQSHMAVNQYKDAFEVLNRYLESNEIDEVSGKGHVGSSRQPKAFSGTKKELSIVYKHFGQICYTLDYRHQAFLALKKSLELDMDQLEALDCLGQYNLCSRTELVDFVEQALIPCLPTGPFGLLLKQSYMLKMNMTFSGPEPNGYSCTHLRTECSFLLKCPSNRIRLAELAFESFRYEEAFSILTHLFQFEGDHVIDAYPLFASVCVSLTNKSSVFFDKCHFLLEHYPSEPCTWYAVGSFYFMKNKLEEAKQFYSKATSCDPRFSLAWIGHGHVFSFLGEHDHAIMAYTNAESILPKHSMPKMYIGMEYLSMKNFVLAEKYYKEALALSPQNIILLNEIGIFYYKRNQYVTAFTFLQKAIHLVMPNSNSLAHGTSPLIHSSDLLSTLFTNLGLIFIKTRQVDLALWCFKKASKLSPSCAIATSSLGIACHLKGHTDAAIACYIQSLKLSSKNRFVQELYDRCLKSAL